MPHLSYERVVQGRGFALQGAHSRVVIQPTRAVRHHEGEGGYCLVGRGTSGAAMRGRVRVMAVVQRK